MLSPPNSAVDFQHYTKVIPVGNAVRRRCVDSARGSQALAPIMTITISRACILRPQPERCNSGPNCIVVLTHIR